MKIISLALICLLLFSSAVAVKNHSKQKSLQNREHKKRPSDEQLKNFKSKHAPTPENPHERVNSLSKKPHNNLSTSTETETGVQLCSFDLNYDFHSVADLNMDQDLLESYADELYDYYSCCNGVLYTYYLIDIIAYNAGWAQIFPPTMECIMKELQWWDPDGDYCLSRDDFKQKLAEFVSQVADGTHPGQDGGFDYQGNSLEDVANDSALAEQLANQAFDVFSDGGDAMSFWPVFDLIQYNCGWAGIGHTNYCETDYFIQQYGSDGMMNREQYQMFFQDFLDMALGECM